MALFAEEIKCTPDTLLIDYVPFSTQERIQVCQKKIDGKFVKHGQEIIYNKDSSIKSKKYYQNDILTSPSILNKNEMTLIGSGMNSPDQDVIIANFESTCLLRMGGLRCWGADPGDGMNEDKKIPTQVLGLVSDVQSAGIDFLGTCVVVSGEVKCWRGVASFFVPELKDNKGVPVQIVGLSDVKKVTDTHYQFCVLTTNGIVKCRNQNVLPKWEELLINVKEISYQAERYCALMNAGNVYCWGNQDGFLRKDNNTPKKILGLNSEVKSIVSGIADFALMVDGSVKYWGTHMSPDGSDQFAFGSNSKNIAIQVPYLTSGVQEIASGSGYHSCVLMNDGGVKCWGLNTDGQLGDGTKINQSVPTQVKGLTSGVKAIAVGSDHSCALKNDGEVMCWGRNTHGQLGDGTTTTRIIPTKVVGL